MLLPKKIFAVEPKEYTIRYAQQYTEVLYGVRSPINSIWNISKIFIIPLALIIGFIIYFKKSKSTTKRKIITMIIVLLVVIAIVEPLYGPPASEFEALKNNQPTFIESVLRMVKPYILPILFFIIFIFIIGSIIFFRKSKAKIKEKVITWLLTFLNIVLFIIIFCGIYYVMTI